MAEFNLKSDFTPSGDQPQAISSITNALSISPLLTEVSVVMSV